MFKQLRRLFIPLSIIIILTACSGGGSGPVGSPSVTSGLGTLSVSITGSKTPGLGTKAFNPNTEHGRIETYSVKIEGPGIPEVIAQEFPGDVTEGVIENVPVGENRVVSVTATNPNGVIIRAGETPGVQVGGDITPVSVALEAVPIFTNLADDNVVPNTRLVIKVFSDPADPVIIEDEFLGDAVQPQGNAATVLVDISTNQQELYPDPSGNAKLTPTRLVAGRHSLTAKSALTGRLSSVLVRLTDGTKLKAAPLFSGGIVRQRAKLGHAVVNSNRDIGALETK